MKYMYFILFQFKGEGIMLTHRAQRDKIMNYPRDINCALCKHRLSVRTTSTHNVTKTIKNMHTSTFNVCIALFTVKRLLKLPNTKR